MRNSFFSNKQMAVTVFLVDDLGFLVDHLGVLHVVCYLIRLMVQKSGDHQLIW